MIEGNQRTVSLEELRAIARELRLDVLEMTRLARSGHPSSSFSSVEVVTARKKDFTTLQGYQIITDDKAVERLQAAGSSTPWVLHVYLLLRLSGRMSVQTSSM